MNALKRIKTNFSKVTGQGSLTPRFFKTLLGVILCTFLIFALKGTGYLFLIILSALVHETGHIVLAKLLSVPFVRVNGTLFGLRLKYDFSRSGYLVQITVGCAGAAFNVIAAVLTMFLVRNAGFYSVFFVFSNLALALFNLMPVSGFDGSGVLRCLVLLVTKDVFRAEKVCNRVSVFFSMSFFLLTVYIQMRVGVNLTLLLLSLFLLYGCISKASSKIPC